jgi:hypothetical protein
VGHTLLRRSFDKRLDDAVLALHEAATFQLSVRV